MILFFGKIISIPVRVLAQLGSMVRSFDTTSLWSASWNLSGNVSDGTKMLSLVCRRDGIESGRELAVSMLNETGDCEIAATMGLMEYYYHQDTAWILHWAKMARERGFAHPEQLLYLELILSKKTEHYDHESVVEEILARNDLASHVTVTAMLAKSNILLEKQMWPEAEAIADFLLSISELADARLIKWAACLHRGKENAERKHFALARAKLPGDVFNVIAGQYALYAGDRELAMEFLSRGDIDSLRVGESNSKLGELVRSDEFRKFCMEKENQ